MSGAASELGLSLLGTQCINGKQLTFEWYCTWKKMQDASWIQSYFDNVMTKFMINNRTDAWKTDVNLLTLSRTFCSRIHWSAEYLILQRYTSKRSRERQVPYKILNYYYHFGGHWENKNWKKWQQNTLENIFFTSAVRKRQQTLKWLLDFDWLLRSYDYLILIFYWFISAG